MKMENREKHRRKYDFQWPNEDEMWEKAKGRMRKRQHIQSERFQIPRDFKSQRHWKGIHSYLQLDEVWKQIMKELLEGLQLGVSLSLMARTVMEKISMINSAVIMEEEKQQWTLDLIQNPWWPSDMNSERSSTQ